MEALLQINKVLAHLIWYCERVVHDMFCWRLLPIWKIHFLKIRKLFLRNDLRQCGLSSWSYRLRITLCFFLIFSKRFNSFMFFLKEILVSIIEIQDFLNPLKALFEMRLVVHKGNYYLVLSL